MPARIRAQPGRHGLRALRRGALRGAGADRHGPDGGVRLVWRAARERADVRRQRLHGVPHARGPGRLLWLPGRRLGRLGVVQRRSAHGLRELPRAVGQQRGRVWALRVRGRVRVVGVPHLQQPARRRRLLGAAGQRGRHVRDLGGVPGRLRARPERRPLLAGSGERGREIGDRVVGQMLQRGGRVRGAAEQRRDAARRARVRLRDEADEPRGPVRFAVRRAGRGVAAGRVLLGLRGAERRVRPPRRLRVDRPVADDRGRDAGGAVDGRV
mmetsp:Transcript_15932/g.55482  ORF Transcript_15932/g.55482 Transcript_15932/m.55482 type:complete len:269 (+) Transcript_15932:1501-2307(+)